MEIFLASWCLLSFISCHNYNFKYNAEKIQLLYITNLQFSGAYCLFTTYPYMQINNKLLWKSEV